MNSVRRLWIGWIALGVAGGGAYYLAKQSIIADRASKYEKELKRKAQQPPEKNDRLYENDARSPQLSSMIDDANRRQADVAQFQNVTDNVASPSLEGSRDPAPTRHEPETEEERILEKSKYEAVPYRPPRGNRLG